MHLVPFNIFLTNLTVWFFQYSVTEAPFGKNNGSSVVMIPDRLSLEWESVKWADLVAHWTEKLTNNQLQYVLKTKSRFLVGM